MRNSLRAFSVVVAAVSVALSCAEGATIRVPADHATVLAGVDAASPGDTVLVAPGTWSDREARLVIINGELLVRYATAFLRPGIHLISESGPEVTILDGGAGHGSVITVVVTGEGGETSVIEGFTITGEGHGVIVDQPASTVIRECRFNDNGAHGMMALRSEVVVEDSEFSRNHIFADSGASHAIDVRSDASLTLRNCLVSENYAGGLVVWEGVSILLEDCDFLDHAGRRAVHVSRAADLQIRRCRFLRNSIPTSSGGAVGVAHASGVIEFCVFAHDTSHAGFSGGLHLNAETALTVRNNTFFECHARNEGAALSTQSTSTIFTHNIVVGCTGSPALWGSPASSECNLFWGNPDGNYHDNWTPDSTDIHADPQFCAPDELNLTLYSTSPAAGTQFPACGPIGALGVGCDPDGIEPTSWGTIKSRYRERRDERKP